MCWIRDTNEHVAIHIVGISRRDVELLTPLIVGIRAEKDGNGDGHFQMHGGRIRRRRKEVAYPDESEQSA